MSRRHRPPRSPARSSRPGSTPLQIAAETSSTETTVLCGTPAHPDGRASLVSQSPSRVTGSQASPRGSSSGTAVSRSCSPQPQFPGGDGGEVWVSAAFMGTTVTRRGSRRSTVSATRRGERKPGELGRGTTQPARGSARNIGDATGSPTSCLDRNRDDARLTWPRWSSTLGAAAAR